MIPASDTRQIASICLAYAAAGVFWGALAASLPALQAQSGLGDGAFGIALGAMALVALPVMRIFGRHLHRIEATAIPTTMTVMAAGAAVLPVLPGLWGLLIAFAITGGASGALDIALNARTARIESDAGVRLFNRTHAIFPAASLLTSAATGFARGADVPLSFIFAVVTLALLASAWLERGAGRHIMPAPGADTPPPARLNGVLMILALIAAAAAFQEAASQGWAAIFVERIRDAGPVLAGLAPAAYTLGLSAGRLIAHAAEVRLRGAIILQISAIFAIIGFALIPAGLPMPLTLLAFFVAGLGTGPVEPAIFQSTAQRNPGAARGPALAAVTAVAYLGYLLSPPALGIVAQGLGFSALWGISAGMACVIAILALRLSRS